MIKRFESEQQQINAIVDSQIGAAYSLFTFFFMHLAGVQPNRQQAACPLARLKRRRCNHYLHFFTLCTIFHASIYSGLEACHKITNDQSFFIYLWAKLKIYSLFTFFHASIDSGSPLEGCKITSASFLYLFVP